MAEKTLRLNKANWRLGFTSFVPLLALCFASSFPHFARRTMHSWCPINRLTKLTFYDKSRSCKWKIIFSDIHVMTEFQSILKFWNKSTTGWKFSEEKLMKTRELSGRKTDTPSLSKAIASTRGFLSQNVRQRSPKRCRGWGENMSYDRAQHKSTRGKSSNLGCSAGLMNSCVAASILSVCVRCHGIITL